MDTCNARIKPNLTPSLRHTIMSNLITVFLAACRRAHDLKKTRLINPRKKQHYYFQAFYLIPLPGGSKVKMVETLFQSLHIPYIMTDLSFSTFYMQFFFIYPIIVRSHSFSSNSLCYTLCHVFLLLLGHHYYSNKLCPSYFFI